ncbi:hypothetical protein F0P96_04740 [Hymenobacter busanensis]|uniref:Uncharacterized protein n=1 Tax=Hymenobacter busanensis TaxID=2607656 RepID=A0A7L5A2Q7_9BACT|nr:hypothetical protein [Hymenobacter busanensis]KAA9338159.1 hypothetical protein F0P96_04740 [Hymenobacter busanensis]QHJ09416.1 hypothetical protein GUY19_19870 [Hymenobacter busanensis]
MLCLVWPLAVPAVAQSAEAGGAAEVPELRAAVRHVTSRYLEALGGEALLYNGPEYINYDNSQTEGHQFFVSDQETLGTVDYDGFAFPNVPLLYDLNRDVLVARNKTSPAQLQLVSEWVHAFELHGHRFVRLVATGQATAPPVTGFYDVVAGQPTAAVHVLVKRTKELQNVAGKGVLKVFVPQDRYYVFSQGRYHAVAGKSSVLAAFPDRQKDLRKYAKTQHLKFGREQREKSIVLLASYYASPAPAAAN